MGPRRPVLPRTRASPRRPIGRLLIFGKPRPVLRCSCGRWRCSRAAASLARACLSFVAGGWLGSSVVPPRGGIGPFWSIAFACSLRWLRPLTDCRIRSCSLRSWLELSLDGPQRFRSLAEPHWISGMSAGLTILVDGACIVPRDGCFAFSLPRRALAVGAYVSRGIDVWILRTSFFASYISTGAPTGMSRIQL